MPFVRNIYLTGLQSRIVTLAAASAAIASALLEEAKPLI